MLVSYRPRYRNSTATTTFLSPPRVTAISTAHILIWPGVDVPLVQDGTPEAI